MRDSSTITVRLDPQLKRKLDQLADTLQRSQSWLIAEAIASYVEQQAWQIEQIQDALDEADRPEAHWIDHEKVSSWLHTFGDTNESIDGSLN